MDESKSVTPTRADPVCEANVDLDRDVFMRTLVRELSGVLTDVVGLEEASGFVSVVGQRMGEAINDDYRSALGREKLDGTEVKDVLIDLKRRIRGDFYLIEQTGDRIVLGNRACPFAEKVLGRPALCMMTSNVFGSIAAANLGYAKVELRETIAAGAPECRIAVHLNPDDATEEVAGREYFDREDAG